jgi:hypothetical protein
MIGIFWVVNFKTRNYFVIFYYTDVHFRLSMYDCSLRGYGVTVTKGIFTFYMNVKIVTAKI